MYLYTHFCAPCVDLLPYLHSPGEVTEPSQQGLAWLLWPPHCPLPETPSKSQKEKSGMRQLGVVTLCPADLFDFSGTSVPGSEGAVGCPQVTVTPWGTFLWERSDANKSTPLANSCVVVSF